ncbi:hypothetical protein P3T76_015676 [Phytophthora citrophthora]|uniref:Uncharacterized protein n=1 Tax=Phytophthora citrophthora TaxID=4793 RepID=A0AAD9FZM4_9STRA|nr:hypothetical protein P3T76_015676 [Phytophthora citrophthora]
MSFEERDQKTLLYQQQSGHNNTPPAIPVVYVDGDGATDRANGRNLSSASSVSSPGQDRNSGGRASGGSGILKGRYSDHPNCDVCGLAFDVTKRRHQWCVCV